ncbi:hypothetical protein Tco_0675916 [Tanacetum coccineum]
MPRRSILSFSEFSPATYVAGEKHDGERGFCCSELVLVKNNSSYARAMIEVRADVELKDTIVVAMPKLTGEGFNTCNVCVEYEWKPPRCACCKVFGHVLDECPNNIDLDVVNNMKSLVKLLEPTTEVSNSNPFDVLNLIQNDVYLSTNGGSPRNVESTRTSNTPMVEKNDKMERLIIEGKVTLVDDDSKDEVASADNDMANFLTSKKDSYGNNSLLEQWKDSYINGDYDFEPYDDDMYEGQDIPDKIQAICDNFDITFRGPFPNQIQLEQRNDLESDVTNDEIKKAVWECGTDKAPGPDGFTFGFFRKFWHLVENEVQDAVRFVSQENSLWARVIKAVHGKDGSIGINVKNVSNSVWLNIIREINVLSEKGINLMNQLRIKLGNGEMTHFWDDNWCEGGRLKDRFPRVYALEECKDITVGSKLAQPSITQSFRRMPRGGVEQMQVDDLINLVQNISLIPMQDRWTWTLNSSGFVLLQIITF